VSWLHNHGGAPFQRRLLFFVLSRHVLTQGDWTRSEILRNRRDSVVLLSARTLVDLLSPPGMATALKSTARVTMLQAHAAVYFGAHT